MNVKNILFLFTAIIFFSSCAVQNRWWRGLHATGLLWSRHWAWNINRGTYFMEQKQIYFACHRSRYFGMAVCYLCVTRS